MTFHPTPPQREAIEAGDSALCIRAGAGSGKTRALAERVAAAVGSDSGAALDVAGVLAVTFTDKAAGEIAERVRRVLLSHGMVSEARRIDEAWISTIHGLCSRILRTNALSAGLDPEFGVATQVEAGLMQDEAFECVLREALTGDAEAEALIGEYGLGRVRRAVGVLHGRLRSMGRSSDDLVGEQAQPAAALLEEAISFREQAAALLREHPSPGKTLAGVIEGCGSAAEKLRALRVWSDGDAGLVREILRVERAYRPGGNVGSARPLLDEVKAMREGLLDRLVAAVTAPHAAALVRLTRSFEARYSAAKAQRGLLDFEDLQLVTLRLFEGDPGLVARYRDLFGMVMVDEFQDTNRVQIRLADLLGGDRLCTVGDDKQSIYGFRYADVEAYRAHSAGLVERGALSVSFATNFRSHPDILGLVNGVFGSETVFGEDLLRLEHGRDESAAQAWPSGQPRLQAVFIDDAVPAGAARKAEAEAIALRLRELADAGVRQGDMVLLLRSLTNAETYATALAGRGLDYVVSAGGAFFGRPEVEAVRAFLRAVVNACDDEAVFALLASGLVGVSDDGLMRLREATGAGTVWDPEDPPRLSMSDEALVRRAEAAVQEAKRRAGRVPLAEIVLRACEELDYDLYLLARGPEGRRAWANVLKVMRLAEEFEHASGGGASAFLEHLLMKQRYDDRESPAGVAGRSGDAVRLMSIHAAKGLEFPVVVVPDLGRSVRSDAESFVLGSRGDGLVVSLSLPDETGRCRPEERQTALFRVLRGESAERELAEEKRLFYVACTRAREALILTGTTTVDDASGQREGTGRRAVDWLRHGLGLADRPVRGIGEVTLAGGAVSVAVSVLDPTERVDRPALPRQSGPPPLTLEGLPAPTPAMVPEADAGPPPTVSYSDISLFKVCPLRYRFERRSPLGAPASADRSARDLGDAVHAALTLVGPDGAGPSKDRLAAIAAYWRLGSEAVTRLRSAVDGFLASEACRLAHADGARALHEVPFAVPLTGALLIGKMDLLRREGADALVVDYKTGLGAGGADAAEDSRLEHWREQADCYALAAIAAGAERVELRFVRVEVLEDGRPVEEVFVRTAEDEPRLRAAFEEAVEAIGSGPHQPLAAYRPDACDACPAAGRICPIGAPGCVSARTSA